MRHTPVRFTSSTVGPVLLGHVDGEVVAGDAGVGDDHVEAAEAVEALGHGGVEAGLVAHVGHAGHAAPPGLLDQAAGLGQVVLGGGG